MSTSARTRPLSFEEIMSRRKKKLDQVTATELNEGDVVSDEGHKHALKIDDEMPRRDEGHKNNTLKVVDEMPTRNHHTESNSKSKSKDTAKSSRDKESHHSHHRSRASEKVSEKKQVRDKHEKDRSSRKEGKRKHDRSEVVDSSVSKKHEISRPRENEYLERKERKNSHSHSRTTYNEESRSKRRRSRSREYEREKQRSVSLSPKPPHRRPYAGRDYNEPPFEPFRGKPRKKYSDADSFKNPGNSGYVSSGHYRKQGSGLGGYSPRKRRTEAAVKSPSPPFLSPERKSSTWDKPPGGPGSMIADFQLPASKVVESVSSVDTTSMPVNANVDSVQLTQATRPARTLYVENLPPSVSEKSVIDCFNDMLLPSGFSQVQRVKPCISCTINKEKCVAVVEFLTPEDATRAISFDGRSLSGAVLKIRRPKDFVEAPTGTQEKIVPVVKAISDVVKDSAHKIFIGGISKALTCDMLMELVSAFGLLRAYHFEFNEELNGSCAFLEYEDRSITPKACAGLTGMKLGGQVLTAVQALPDSHWEEGDSESPPSYGIPIHAKSLLEEPTQVLQLSNVFNPDEFLLLSEPELQETLEDIRLECTRFGTVRSVNVVRFTSNCERAVEASEQHALNDHSAKIESYVKSPSKDSQRVVENVPVMNDVKEPKGVDDVKGPNAVNDVKEPQGVGEDAPHTNHDDEDQLKDTEMKESTDLCSKGRDSDLSEDPSELVKESFGMESGSVTGIPLQESDVTRGEDAKSKEDVTNGDIEQTHVENTKSNRVPDERQIHIFEPGCVMVEFTRKESACVAAHSLHGRMYGERIVSAGYVSHDLYLSQFPR